MNKDQIIEALQEENRKLKVEALVAFDSQEQWRKKADRWKAGSIETERLHEELHQKFNTIATKFSNDNETRALLIADLVKTRTNYDNSILFGDELIKLVMVEEFRTQERVDKAVADWQHLPRWE
jgi:predicted RNase H-like nuclease (RuvC/YqgF family)